MPFPDLFVSADIHSLVVCLTGWPFAGDEQHWILACRSVLDSLLEIRDRLHRLVIDSQDDESIADTAVFEGTVLDILHLQAIADAQLLLELSADRNNLGTEYIQVGSLNDLGVALHILDGDGLAHSLLIVEPCDGELVAGMLAVDDFLQFGHLCDVFTVNADDDIAFGDSGSRGSTVVLNLSNIDTVYGSQVRNVFVLIL